MGWYVISFESTHAAMASERALVGQAAASMIPTPREISAGCGMSLRFQADSRTEAVRLASACTEAAGLAAVYEKRQDGSYALVKNL